MNVAERQAVRSGTPAAPTSTTPVAPVTQPILQAPVNPTTGLSAPLQSTAPVTPTNTQNVSDVAPTTPKTDATP